MQTQYFLCSKEVVKHFPTLAKSQAFKSGYTWDNDNYYIIATTDYEAIQKYYDEVVAPYNDKSNVALNFWLRECCPSQVDAFMISKKECRSAGVFRAIENALGLTKETNVAFAIYSMAEKYRQTPIEFINSLTKQAAVI